jgi:enoyl-CoA hydratase
MSNTITNCLEVARIGAIHGITINRPESLNALNPDILQSLLVEFQDLARDEEIRVVVIRGAGTKAFVAGADVRSMNEFGPRPIADFVELGQRALRAIESCRVPVVAAINGFALGGGLELAMACDLIVCSESSKLGQPEVNLGIIPGFGGTQRLIQRCGIGRARRLCLTAELLSANEALSLGVVDKVFPDHTFWEQVQSLSELLCAKAPLALQAIKRAINRAGEQELLAGLRREVEEFLHVFSSADRVEGMDAFLEKRKADFKGR